MLIFNSISLIFKVYTKNLFGVPILTEAQKFVINKILKVDYFRGRAKEYLANFISARSRKSNFFYFTPPSVIRLTSPLNFRGENMEPRGRASMNFLIKKIAVL